MRTTAAALAAIGALLLGFGWWGLHTAAGRLRFDEMAGMIPLAAEVLGAVLLLCGVVVVLLDARARRRSRRG